MAEIYVDQVTTTDTVWTVKQLCDYAEQGLVRFDNVVQRGYVWTKQQWSLLIHSIIVNFMPPEFLANKVDGIYDMIDGKQRYGAMSRFLNDEFRLVDVPDIMSGSGAVYVLNGKQFSDLSAELQEKITGRGLKISVIDNGSQEIIREYFYRRNNGRQLSSEAKTFAMAKSFEEIAELSQHELLTTMFPSPKGGEARRGIAMKSYMILNCENKSLENKKIASYIKRVSFSQSQIDEISVAYDILLEAYNHFRALDTKTAKKVAKRILTKTHLLSLMPLANKISKSNIAHKRLFDWLYHFYNSDVGASVSEVYNANATTGSSQSLAVENRLRIIEDDFENFA